MIIGGLVLLATVLLFVLVVLPARKRGNERYRRETDQRIDDALGTWVPESMVARDRRRGYGRWAKVKLVREED